MKNEAASVKFDKFLFDTDFFEVIERKNGGDGAGTPAMSVMDIPDRAAEADISAAQQIGFAAGVQEGRAAAAAEFQTQSAVHFDKMESVIARIEASQQNLLAQLETRLLPFTKLLLQKAVGEAAQKFPEEILKQTLTQAATLVHETATLTIRLAPSTLDFFEQMGLREKLFTGRKLNIVPDQTLTAGECVVEWNTGGVEGKLENLLAGLNSLLGTPS